MRIQTIILALISISFLLLTSCSHVAGNVIADSGPTMEKIYDDLGDSHAPTPSLNIDHMAVASERALSSGMEPPTFSKLGNPILKLYVFPHLAGTEMLPIPGYWTAFSAYSRDYYALPLSVNSDMRNLQ